MFNIHKIDDVWGDQGHSEYFHHVESGVYFVVRNYLDEWCAFVCDHRGIIPILKQEAFAQGETINKCLDHVAERLHKLDITI